MEAWRSQPWHHYNRINKHWFPVRHVSEVEKTSRAMLSSIQSAEDGGVVRVSKP
jgi:hypothetical protein